MTLAAEYTQGKQPTLCLNYIFDGRRTKVIAFNVSGKREARVLAKTYNATPWNF